MGSKNLSKKSLSGYDSLLNLVKKTLIKGRRRVAVERLRTYWETGDHIRAHILKYADRAEYGAEVILRLAKDLNVDRSVLNRCVKFVEIYPKMPIGARGHQFNWSHYRRLMTITDKKKRLLLENSVIQKGWTPDELAARIREESPAVSSGKDQPRSLPSSKISGGETDRRPLTPMRGQFHTYQIIDRPNAQTGEPTGLRVDLGFGTFHKVAPALLSRFSKGDIVESRPKEDEYRFYKTDRGPKDMYTYLAEVEKVIDGDTLKVRFDLGFDMEVRETLRLRGIDCTGFPKLFGSQYCPNCSI